MLFLSILSQTAKTGAAPLLPLLRELQQIMMRSNLSLLFSRLNNSSGLSRSLYGFSSRSFLTSVFLLWLLSNSFSSLCSRAQNCSQWGYPSTEQDSISPPSPSRWYWPWCLPRHSWLSWLPGHSWLIFKFCWPGPPGAFIQCCSPAPQCLLYTTG